MHIAAIDPRYIRKEEVTEADIEREKDIYRAQAAATGKPANIIEKMLEGKLGKFYEEVCLLEQPFIKEQTQTIAQIIATKVAQARRKHQRPPFRPLQGRRSELHRGQRQGGCRGSSPGVGTALQSKKGGGERVSTPPFFFNLRFDVAENSAWLLTSRRRKRCRLELYACFWSVREIDS